MSWSYIKFTHKRIDFVINELFNAIRTYDPEEASTAKIATSDQKDGYARGVIFINNKALPTPVEYPKGKWTQQTFKTGTDFEALYRSVVKKLNNLTNNQAYYAKVTYSDFSGGGASMTLWYGSIT